MASEVLTNGTTPTMSTAAAEAERPPGLPNGEEAAEESKPTVSAVDAVVAAATPTATAPATAATAAAPVPKVVMPITRDRERRKVEFMGLAKEIKSLVIGHVRSSPS
jgi:hypothetical protein